MQDLDWNNLVEKLLNPETYLPWLINLGVAIAIVFFGRYVVKFLMMIARRVLARAGFDEILQNFICSIAKSFLYLVLLVVALDQIGVDTTSLIALIGAAGLAIGLALQDSLKNFASGVMLIVFRPFTEGDFVEAGGTSGSVKKVNIFSTVMKSPDNKEIIVPNGEIFSGTIINYSANDERRVDWVFGIGYGDDLKKAKTIIQSLVESDERIKTDPEPLIVVGELGDSSVNLIVRAWVATGDFWDVKFEMTENVKLAFDEQGISIPFPQMDVHMDKAA